MGVKALLIMITVAFAVGFIIGIIIMVYLRKTFEKKTEAKTKDFIQKESNLEKVRISDLVDNSLRADALREQSDTIAQRARQRIRDRSKQIVSGKSDN